MNEILIVGDIYLGHKDTKELAEKKEINSLFGDFSKIIKNSDYSIGNLESPVTESNATIPKTGPHLKTTSKSLEILKDVGFDLLTLANNHILDFGKSGLMDTIENCNRLGLAYVGVGKSLKEARIPKVVKINEQSVCIINISENEFSTIGNSSYGANPMDLINNNYDIVHAKKLYDKVVVIVHGGREHYNLPSPNFRKTLRFYAESGADAVIAHHTHCVSGYELYKGKPIFYGLGNFIFKNLNFKEKSLWNKGLAIKLKINKDDISYKLYPYSQCQNSSDSIQMIKGDEKDAFMKNLDELNSIIENDDLVQSHWMNYIDSERKAYKSLMFVKNKWVKKFVNRNIIPVHVFTNKVHSTTLVNLIRCETHREILLDSLKK